MRYFTVVLLFLIAICSNGQDLNSIYKESIAAYENKDYAKFVTLNKEALKLHPSQPTILYNLAAGYSLMGNIGEAFQTLQRILSWNSSIDYQMEADFKTLLLSDKHKSALDSLTEYYQQVQKKGIEHIRFKGQRHLEDLVLLDSFLFATDVYHGEVIRYNTKNNLVDVLQELDLPVLALAANPNSKSIWVSTAKLAQSKKKGSPSSTPEVLEIDGISGKILSKTALADDFVAGSMVFDSEDNLYISSSSKPEIVIIDAHTNTVKQILPVNDGFNLQGVTIDLENNMLYVADYIKGILTIDLHKEYQMTWLKCDSFLLKGIDGLTYVKKNKLVAIQNNSNPKRVIQLQIQGSTIERVTFLDNNLESSGEPTNGKYYDNLGFIYISNSSWPHYDKNSAPLFDKWEEQKILRIKPESIAEN